jgi:hypothetical protein
MNHKEEHSAPAKKAYQQPSLRHYGTFTEITHATTNTGNRIDSRNPVQADRTH